MSTVRGRSRSKDLLPKTKDKHQLLNERRRANPCYRAMEKLLAGYKVDTLIQVVQHMTGVPELTQLERRNREALICWFCEWRPELLIWPGHHLEMTMISSEYVSSTDPCETTDDADLEPDEVIE
jgi:hypothetical protein